jgi:hypothetical protein
MKATFPANYGETCVLVPIDIALIPIISGHLKYFEERRAWLSDSDFEQGYNAIAELRANMTNNCMQEITDRLDKLYRLLDTSLNGTQYLNQFDPQTGTASVTPSIPDTPPASTSAENAMRAHIGRLWQLAENSTAGRTFAAGAGIAGSPALDDNISTRETLRQMQGEINAGWFGIGGQRATIADLINSVKLGSGDDEQQVLTALDGIVGASSGATIFNTIRSLLTDSADVGLEGGQIIVQLVAAMGQIMSNHLLSGQLQRVIDTLDGGNLVAPEDNILLALRGDVPASPTRNVIDAAGAGGELADLAAIAADVEEIRQKVQ